MATVYLALGSNVGDPERQIEQAVTLLVGRLNNIRRAPLYRSRAVGYTDQADFVNTALSAETSLTPEQLLVFTQEVEQQVGRKRRFRWGPREIDVDIIFYGDTVRRSSELSLPHPEFRTRDFVLRPLADLNPKLKDPSTGRTVSQLLADLPTDRRSIIGTV
jgi:2-amino-4-hydroxy-6-hydroxymethyldihydropteridine diphosphokinase